MLIRRKTFDKEVEGAYARGFDTGYRLGFRMGMVEAQNRMWGEPKSLLELQLEDILKRKWDE